MAQEPPHDRLVLTFDDPDGLSEAVRVVIGFSTYSSLTEKAAKGRSFFCPLLLTGDPVHKKCNSTHQYKGGFLFRHLEGKEHPGVPATWKTFFGVDT